MNKAELDEIVHRLRALGADHLTCEVKRAKGGLPVSLWESVSAFANGSGGQILLGIDERSGFSVTGVDDPAAAESQLGALCSEMEPPVRAEIQTVTYEGRQVVVCTVPQISRDQRPCHKRALGPWAGSRIRVADGDRKLTDYEVAVLLANRTEQRHDLTPIAHANPADLDAELIQSYLRRIRETKGEIFRRLDDTHALSLLNVITEADGRMVPTLAGLLAFGVYPQSAEPQLNLTFVGYPANTPGVLGRVGERFVENVSVDGPIPLIVAECLRVLKRNMRRRSIVSGIYRVDEWEYPEEVVREAVVNALVHRDYAEAARGMQVQVELYPDRLVIRNPGGLYGPVDVSSLGISTVTSSRNKALLKILEDTPLGDGHMVCENRGSGIARMLMALTEAGMEPPHFIDDISTFTVEFPNHALLDSEALDWLSTLNVRPLTRAQMTALAMMRNGVVLTNSSYRASTGIQDSRIATRDLRELVESGVVEQTGTRGTATYQLADRQPAGAAPEPLFGGDDDLSANERTVLRLLRSAPHTRNEVEIATSLTKAQVRYALETLRGKGLTSFVGDPRSRTARWTAGPSSD